MKKVLTIDGKEVGFCASALTTRLYRHKFGRDFFKDINALRKSFVASAKSGENELEVLDLETFENITYIMAKQYDQSIPENPDEWLDGFEMFSIYYILPEILELWAMNEATTSTPKKG